MRPIQTTENVTRRFDLVKPKDDKLIPAFYSVLQNTLVAENLQQANRDSICVEAFDITPETIAKLERDIVT
ncbi:18826_t:CDS:2 [Funneliformis geosporum]|nr:18826_t:CDS:2 [Funneliformis geosporum]